jgi:hypothetical protein
LSGRFRPSINLTQQNQGSRTGETLDHCDVTQVALNGDLRTWTIEGDMYFYCNVQSEGEGNGLAMAGVASFGVSALPARQSNFLRLTKSASQDGVANTVERLYVNNVPSHQVILLI